MHCGNEWTTADDLWLQLEWCRCCWSCNFLIQATQPWKTCSLFLCRSWWNVNYVLYWLVEMEKGLWIAFCVGVQASTDKLRTRHGAQKRRFMTSQTDCFAAAHSSGDQCFSIHLDRFWPVHAIMSDTNISIFLLHSLEDTYGVSSVQYDRNRQTSDMHRNPLCVYQEVTYIFQFFLHLFFIIYGFSMFFFDYT